jgi:hypothetical protein
LTTVNLDLQQRDLRSTIALHAIGLKRFIVMMVLVSFMVVGIGVFPLIHKVSAHARALFFDASSGLVVSPGNAEVAYGDDFIVEAVIERGVQQAQIVMLAENGRFTYEMYVNEAGIHSFAFAGVDNGFRYYVQTPTLSSATYRVNTYEKARLTAAAIDIFPPAYTGLPEQRIDELKNITVPRQSRVHLNITTNVPAKVRMLIDNRPSLDFIPSDQLQQAYIDLNIDRSFAYVLEITDDSGRCQITPVSYKIESIDDFAPIIQVISPEEDARRRIDQEITFSFKVNDDYGVQSINLHYSINGSSWENLDLYRADSAELDKEKMVAQVLNLIGKVKDGDIIAFYGSAMDAAMPEPNAALTDVRFIEMRPEKIDGPEIEAMGQAQIKTLQVNDLIVAQKRLIRSTWSINFMDTPDSRKEQLTELNQMAHDLTTTSTNRYRELFGAENPPGAPADAPFDLVGTLLQNSVIEATIQEKTTLPSGSEQVVQKLFNDAIENMQQAETLLQRELPEESSSYQRQSLSQLVKLAIELEKNTPRGKGSGEGKSEPREDPVKEENKQKENAAKKNRLSQVAASLDKLIDRQDRLNHDIARNKDTAQSRETQEYLSSKQDELQRDAEKLREELKAEGETHSAASQVGEATRNMGQAATNLDQGQMTNAGKHGELALQFLQRAMELVQDQKNRISDEALWKTDKMLEALQKRQYDLMQKSNAQMQEENPPYPNSDLADQQQQIRSEFENLLKRLGETVNTVDERKPQIADELRAAMEKAEINNTTNTMKRAENASRYSLWNKAYDYQKQADQSLSQMSQHLKNAMRMATAMSPEQMTRMLQQVLGDLQKVQQAQNQQAAPETMQELFESIQKNLQDITDLLNDPVLDQLSQEMTVTALSGGAGKPEANEQVLTTLTKVARLLETRLMQSTLQAQLKLTRASGQEPPDEFKKLVQKYFTKIGSSF